MPEETKYNLLHFSVGIGLTPWDQCRIVFISYTDNATKLTVLAGLTSSIKNEVFPVVLVEKKLNISSIFVA